jgi:hypothetical protein
MNIAKAVKRYNSLSFVVGVLISLDLRSTSFTDPFSINCKLVFLTVLESTATFQDVCFSTFVGLKRPTALVRILIKLLPFFFLGLSFQSGNWENAGHSNCAV